MSNGDRCRRLSEVERAVAELAEVFAGFAGSIARFARVAESPANLTESLAEVAEGRLQV